jgi:hypothetical protein
MNDPSKLPLALKYSKYVSSWRFYLHCKIEETDSPGFMCIVCHQVLRHPSEHGITSMRRHLLAQALILKLKELKESEVFQLTESKVDVMAVAILKRQGSQVIRRLSG